MLRQTIYQDFHYTHPGIYDVSRETLFLLNKILLTFMNYSVRFTGDRDVKSNYAASHFDLSGFHVL